MDKYLEILHGIWGRFTWHLSDTHGIPKEVTLERWKKIEFDFRIITLQINKHKDFIRQDLKRKKSE